MMDVDARKLKISDALIADIPSTSKEAKKVLQSLLDSGSIVSLAELLNYVDRCGWHLSRRGEHYLGIVHRDGKHFRVRYRSSGNRLSAVSALIQESAEGKHSISSQSPEGKSYLIYALIARDQLGRAACYVGQTVNFQRRMREHLKRRFLNRSSAALFDWADTQRVTVHVVVLTNYIGTQSGALKAENSWRKLAAEAGHIMVGESVKSALHDPIYPEFWPFNCVLAASRPITGVVDGTVPKLTPIWPVQNIRATPYHPVGSGDHPQVE